MAVILPAPVYVITSELAAKPTEYKIGTSKTYAQVAGLTACCLLKS